jgi:Protein of unknown function (DUF3667)
MAHEVDAAALDSVGAAAGRKPPHTRPIGAQCPNCQAALAGPWCHACGQSSEEFHRSLVKLTAEAVGGLFDLDSRLWRTLPDLCLRPARLTRTFLDGHRISQVPPFRLFLVVVVLVFLAAGFGGRTNVVVRPVKLNSKDPVARFFAVPRQSPFQQWMLSRGQAVAKNPERFSESLSTWAQRLVFLALPISALLLGAMFFWRPGVYMFDHLIFSMHSLSFQGVLLSVSMLAMNLNGLFGCLLLIAPVHLFAHLKGTYSLGVFGTLTRMLVLFLGSLVGLIFALSTLLIIGLFEVAP